MKKLMLAVALACLGWRAAEGKASAAPRHEPGQARQSYEAQVKAELGELESKIDALEAQAQKAGVRSRARSSSLRKPAARPPPSSASCRALRPRLQPTLRWPSCSRPASAA